MVCLFLPPGNWRDCWAAFSLSNSYLLRYFSTSDARCVPNLPGACKHPDRNPYFLPNQDQTFAPTVHREPATLSVLCDLCWVGCSQCLLRSGLERSTIFSLYWWAGVLQTNHPGSIWTCFSERSFRSGLERSMICSLSYDGPIWFVQRKQVKSEPVSLSVLFVPVKNGVLLSFASF